MRLSELTMKKRAQGLVTAQGRREAHGATEHKECGRWRCTQHDKDHAKAGGRACKREFCATHPEQAERRRLVQERVRQSVKEAEARAKAKAAAYRRGSGRPRTRRGRRGGARQQRGGVQRA